MDRKAASGPWRASPRAFVGMLAFTAAGLFSQPGFAAEDLVRRCPGVEKQWETVLGSNGASGDPDGTQGPRAIAARRTANGFEMGQGSEFGEQFLRVELPSCASLGYAWWAEYVGGTHIPDAVHPMLWRNGVRVSWQELESNERTFMVRLMKAELGSADGASIAGALWRKRHPTAAQQSPEPSEPPISQLIGLPVDSAAGRPRNERRTFIPCPSAIHTSDGRESEGAWLFFGSRLSPTRRLKSLGISQAALGPAPNPGAGGSSVGRVFGPQPWLVIHEPSADRAAFLPEHRSTLFSGSTVYATGAIAADTTSPGSERAVILGGTQGCDAKLLDLERLRMYSLPGRCPFYDSGPDYAFLSGDLAGRLVWLKPTGASAGDGVTINYAKVVQSQGTEGVERIPAASALAWSVTHKNLNVALTALLFAQDEQAQDEVLAALKRFPGWQAPAESLIGVRTAVRKPRLLVGKENGLIIEELDLSEQPPGLLGFIGDEALLVISERAPASVLVARPRETGAILAVPRSAVFSASMLPRLEALRQAALDHELVLGPANDDGSVSYAEAVVEVLSRRPLTAREKRRACAVERELLAGHERWELEEIIDRYWDASWAPPDDDDPEHTTPRRPAATVRAEWKAMCLAPGRPG